MTRRRTAALTAAAAALLTLAPVAASAATDVFLPDEFEGPADPSDPAQWAAALTAVGAGDASCSAAAKPAPGADFVADQDYLAVATYRVGEPTSWAVLPGVAAGDHMPFVQDDELITCTGTVPDSWIVDVMPPAPPWPFDPAMDTEEYWETKLTDPGASVRVECTLNEGPITEWTIPDGTIYTIIRGEGDDYTFFVDAGWGSVVTADVHGPISRIIACEHVDQPIDPGPIGPIVQTDRPATPVDPTAPLALTLAAGLGLAAVGLRRQRQQG